ncbi:MAG TPA: hypothetical protein VEF05_19125 [Terriglobales bacterium]|nr:hypothetical protein [Terriglobales bacterium]
MKASLRGIWTFALVLLMLYFGLTTGLFGYLVLDEWRSFRSGLLACAAIWLIGGLAMLASVWWIARSLARSRPASLIAGTAAVVSGAVFAVAAATHVLPCSGPD